MPDVKRYPLTPAQAHGLIDAALSAHGDARRYPGIDAITNAHDAVSARAQRPMCVTMWSRGQTQLCHLNIALMDDWTSTYIIPLRPARARKYLEDIKDG